MSRKNSICFSIDHSKVNVLTADRNTNRLLNKNIERNTLHCLAFETVETVCFMITSWQISFYHIFKIRSIFYLHRSMAKMKGAGFKVGQVLPLRTWHFLEPAKS